MKTRAGLGLVAVYAGALMLWWSADAATLMWLPTRRLVPAWDSRAVTWPLLAAAGIAVLVLLVRVGVVVAADRPRPAPPPPPPPPAFALPAVTRWFDPIFLGVDLDGEPVRVSTWNVAQWLIGGTSGSGKTVGMRMILAHYALDPTAILWGVDGKGNRDDWLGFKPRFNRWVTATDRVNGPAQYLQMLEDLGLEIDRRQDISGRDYPGMLVLMDDAPQLRRRLPPADKARADDLLTGIVQTCRAVNVMVLMTTQKPSAKQMDTDQRSQAGIALCMQMDSMDDARMVLGVRPDDDDVVTFPIGHGLLKAGRGKPRRVVIHHLTDEMWAALGRQFAAPSDDVSRETSDPQDADPLLVAAWEVVDAAPGRRLTTEAILAELPDSAPDARRLGRHLTACGWPVRTEWHQGATVKMRHAADAPLRQHPETSPQTGTAPVGRSS